MSTISLYPVVANGNSYNAASFATLGYVTALPAAITDVIAQAAKLFTSTSSTSATIANSGTISITVGTGLAFTTGQYVLCSAQASPQTNFMSGTVTSYVTGSGALQFTANAASGSGTFTAWYVNSCSYNNSLGLGQTNYGIVTSVLGTDQGSLGCPLALTTGNAYYDSQRGSAFLGLESPSTSTIEIFEDFFSVGSVFPAGYYSEFGNSNTAVSPPWWSGSGSSAVFALAPGYINVSAGVLTYGSAGGYLHVGKGAIVTEWIITTSNRLGLSWSFGLAACGAVNVSSNIFGNGGVGFTINTLGYVECVAGIAGQLTRIPTTTYAVSVQGTYRFRVEVDHTGLNAYYYLNDVLLATITPTNGPIGGTEAKNLLILAAEDVHGIIYVNSVYFAKYLTR